MLRIQKLFYNVIYVLASLICLLIIVHAIFMPSMIRKDYIFPVNVLLLIIGALFISVIIILLNKISKNYPLRFRIACMFIILVIELIISLSFQGNGGTDDFNIRMQVASMLNHHYHLSPYFIYASNNIPITILYFFVSKLGITLGITNITILLIWTQYIFIDITLLVLIHLFDVLKQKQVANIMLLWVVMFSPLLIYGEIVYTDVISVCVSIYGAVCFYYYTKKENKYLLFTSGVFEGIAYLIKMNVVIMAISLVIFLLFIVSINLKRLVIELSIFIIGLTIPITLYKATVSSIYNFPASEVSKNSFPYTFWIDFGIDKKLNGAFGPNTYKEGADLETYRKRDEFYRKRIKWRLKNYSLQDWVKLYWNKTNVMYSQGDLGTIEKSYGISKEMTKLYQNVAGPSNKIYILYCQIIYISFLIYALTNLITSILRLNLSFRTKRFNYNDIIALFFIGIFIFHITMWEVMPRYAYVAMFAMLPISSAGVNNVGSMKVSLDIRRVIISEAVLGFALIIGVKNSLGNLVRNSTYNIPVVGQLMPENEYDVLSINPNSSISESINIPKSFRRIDIITWAGGQKIESRKDLMVTVKNNKGKIIDRNEKIKPRGKYTVTIKNISSNKADIAIVNTFPVDLLQKPIQQKPNCYLNLMAYN